MIPRPKATPAEKPAINHRDDCPGLNGHWTVLNEGATVYRCRACRRFTIVSEPTTATTAAPTSPMVCGSHPHRPVDGRGRGCPDCRDETTARRNDKRRGYRGPR